MTIVLLYNLYMPHILTVYTLLLLLFLICNFYFLCPQLVVKTKYIDTLIKLLLTYLLTKYLRVGNCLFRCVQGWGREHKVKNIANSWRLLAAEIGQ